jgi:hypothetical protein
MSRPSELVTVCSWSSFSGMLGKNRPEPTDRLHGLVRRARSAGFKFAWLFGNACSGAVGRGAGQGIKII